MKGADPQPVNPHSVYPHPIGPTPCHDARRPRLSRRMSDSHDAAPDGILPCQTIDALIATGAVSAEGALDAGQVQPASLDLRLGRRAWRVRASFLPRPGATVAARIADVAMHELDLAGGAVLERGCVYIVELAERLSLPPDVCARANPKSSTGRLDVFVRLLTDGQPAFDDIAPGYAGPLFLEIAPQTFPVLARTGTRLNQLRLKRGTTPTLKVQSIGVDLSGRDRWLPRAPPRLRLSSTSTVKAAMTPRDFWEPLTARHGELLPRSGRVLHPGVKGSG